MVYEVHVTATPGSVTSYMYLGKHSHGSRRWWSAWGSWWQSGVPSGRTEILPQRAEAASSFRPFLGQFSFKSVLSPRVQQPRLCTPPGGWAELLPTSLGFLWVLGTGAVSKFSPRAAVFPPHNILPHAQHSASLVPVLGWGWGSGLSQRKQSVSLHSPLTLASSSFLIQEPQAQIK